jgi:PAS domain-containing protein
MLRAKLHAQPVSDATAELHAALAQIQTLLEELQSQSDALSAERQHYADFFEFAPDGYLITEPHGEIREANRAARELLGLKPGESSGASLVAFIPEADRPAFRGKLVSVRGRPEGEMEEWQGFLALISAKDAVRVSFRARSIKVRRKNADGLCWLIRRVRD